MASRECRYCPSLAVSSGEKILGLESEWGVSTIEIPFVWSATGSQRKRARLASSLGILEATHGDGLVDIGYLVPVPMEMVGQRPEELDVLSGHDVAERKVLDYWEYMRSFSLTKQCRAAERCYTQHLLIAGDVNVFAGVAGAEFSKSLLKPGAHGVRTRTQLIEYIMQPYHELSGEVMGHIQRQGVGHVLGELNYVNRIEAAVAMAAPVDKWWKKKPRLVSGVSRAYVQLPVSLMTDKSFVTSYVELVERKEGGLEGLMNAAGGIKHELLIEAMGKINTPVMMSLPADDRLGGYIELLMAHVENYPPRLLWKLVEKMFGKGSDDKVRRITMEPEGWGGRKNLT